ncbi:hypothetical protein CEP54_006034 [Fusarium duplospermum]|uniref:SIS domain-containing protein n=1 Tax=Fusarium duplospermum TaxID=1325734 RepID=A0A428Q9G7_9HYPO|nr:hypothetical protein CEP54_006034 [Fusarium duplospermum]
MSSLELCRVINEEDASVAQAVQTCLPQIADAIDIIVPRLLSGGRVIYTGAGTSGRLGILDASEMLTPPLNKNDILVGIASSGRTPYVLGGLKYARSIGAATVGLACVKPSSLRSLCDVLIECVTGPEVVTGSTRLKAGTATKMILNMISTGSQIRTGKTFGNLMVDLKMPNEKLQNRARRVARMVVPPSSALDIESEEVLDSVLADCDGQVKLSILVATLGCPPAEGRAKLEAASGSLRQALQGNLTD